jgi:hypothetical protein
MSGGLKNYPKTAVRRPALKQQLADDLITTQRQTTSMFTI